MALRCEDAIAILGEYLEAALGATAAVELERHLDECQECTAYLNTYRKTRALAAASGPAEMPAELKTRLRTFLVTRLAAMDIGARPPS